MTTFQRICQAITSWTKIKRVYNAILTFMIQRKIASQELFTVRMNICGVCRYHDEDSDTCEVCGCFLKIKARMKHEHCDLKKW
jgi:rRNA maturation endonuclease Nob1